MEPSIEQFRFFICRTHLIYQITYVQRHVFQCLLRTGQIFEVNPGLKPTLPPAESESKSKSLPGGNEVTLLGALLPTLGGARLHRVQLCRHAVPSSKRSRGADAY